MIDSKKYVVLDVETNGLSSKKHDLLSLSIFKPDTLDFYDRFFPLELQQKVLTTNFNGITRKMLSGHKPLTQEEFNQINDYYELDKRTILTYGDLDQRFLKEYFKRHKIVGFEKLSFKNIKKSIISTYYTNNLLTKDNLCKAFGISGVQDVHSSHNDCVLEWELFKFINGRTLLVTYANEFCPNDVEHVSGNWYIYEFSKDYIVPSSFLHTYKDLKKFLKLPDIEISYEDIFDYKFSKKCSSIYSYQPAGVASELLIKNMLGAKRIDSQNFLINNKRKLHYLGSILASDKKTVVFTENNDGTISTCNKKNSLYIDAINKQNLAIKKEIGPVIDFIKKEIFHNKPIMAQELIINRDYNLLGLCDFSNEDACLECKWTFAEQSINQKYINEFNYQLFVTSNNRPMYIMIGNGNNLTIKKITISLKS